MCFTHPTVMDWKLTGLRGLWWVTQNPLRDQSVDMHPMIWGLKTSNMSINEQGREHPQQIWRFSKLREVADMPEEYGHGRKSSWRPQKLLRIWDICLMRKGSERWDVPHGKEKAQGGFSTYPNVWWERLERMERDYSQCCPVTREESMGKSWTM